MGRDEIGDALQLYIASYTAHRDSTLATKIPKHMANCPQRTGFTAYGDTGMRVGGGDRIGGSEAS